MTLTLDNNQLQPLADALKAGLAARGVEASSGIIAQAGILDISKIQSGKAVRIFVARTGYGEMEEVIGGSVGTMAENVSVGIAANADSIDEYHDTIYRPCLEVVMRSPFRFYHDGTSFDWAADQAASYSCEMRLHRLLQAYI